MENTPFLRIFTAKTPQFQEESPVYPPSRQAEIDGAKNQKIRTQKYGVWKLLQYAVQSTFSRPFTDFVFTKTETGKWTCKDFYLSLSHSKVALAVALSSAPVGVDIQKDEPLSDIKIAKKMLTAEEFIIFQNLPKSQMNAYLVGTWAKKEAAFKRGDRKMFIPQKIELTKEESLATTTIEDENYFLAISSNLLSVLTLQENVLL